MIEQTHPDKLGRYIVVKELGKGAMGIVYEGFDPNIGRKVAIKTARREVLDASGRAEELMERFLREARAAGNLNHPNVITIYDAGEENGLAYIAMEYLEGGSLADRIHANQRMDPDEAAMLCAVVCDALAAAHDKGVVHRDVKPANIMVLPDGTVKVADFGIARVSDSTLTNEGSMIGTPYFMSPEQFMGQKVDARSDLFSVGVICYELLTGEKPFTGEALSTVMHSVLKVTPIEPHELNYSVKRCLSRVVMKALHKDPNRRYQDARAMAAALRECTRENPNPSILNLSSDHWENEATVMNHTAPIATVVTHVPTTPRQPEQTAVPSDATTDTLLPTAIPTGEEKKRGRKAMLISGVSAVVIIAAGLAAYFSMSPANIGGKLDFDFVITPDYDTQQAVMQGGQCAACAPTSGDLHVEAFDSNSRIIEKQPLSNTPGEVLDLPPGTVRVKLTWQKSGMIGDSKTIEVTEPNQRLRVTLPFLPGDSAG